MRTQGFRLTAAAVLMCFVVAYGAPVHAQQQPQPPQPQQPDLYQPPPPQAYPQHPDYPQQPQAYPPPQAYPQQPGYPPPAPVYGQPTYAYPVYAPPRVPVRYVYRPRVGLIVAGSVVLGVSWGITALSAIAASGCDPNYDSLCSTQIWPLFIPVVGPFIQTAYVNGPFAGGIQALLVFDGLVQVAGLAMIIAGAATRHRVPVYAQRFQVTPYAGLNGAGLMAVGRF